MNEEAFQRAYDYFVDNGYTKSKDEFKVLLKDNSTAFNQAYDYFIDNGYSKDKGEFSSLMGVGEIIEEPLKKKRIRKLYYGIFIGRWFFGARRI